MTRRLTLAAFTLLLTLLFTLVIPKGEPTSAQDFGTGPWNATYYNSTDFTNPVAGSYSYTALNLFTADFPRDASGIPIPGIGQDTFSAIYTSSQNFTGGTYLFRLLVDDRARVTIDGVEIFNATAPGVEASVIVVLTPGVHTLVMNYIEFTSTASIQLQWGLQGTTGVVPGATAGPTAVPTITPLPYIPPGSLTATVIRASILNVRDAPSTGANRIARIRRGQTYAVVGRDDRARWFLIELGGYRGWAYGYYLAFNFNEFTAPVASGNNIVDLQGYPDTGVRVQTEAGLRMRAQPNTASPQTGRIDWGAFLPVIGRTGDSSWLLIVWRGTVGWIYAPFVEVIEGDLNTVPIR